MDSVVRAMGLPLEPLLCTVEGLKDLECRVDGLNSLGFRNCEGLGIQGYLAHEDPPPP